MVKKVTYGSVKRLGTRYGRTLRFKLGKIESEQRKKHKCPYCNYVQVRRVSAGIWQCKKCDAKFTNKAYTVGKLSTIVNQTDSGSSKIDNSNATQEVAETE
jgi:large subunit ribosomal protein L37Ae